MTAVHRDLHWTSEHDDLLKELARSGKTLADICKELRRTPGAVRMRAARMGIKLAKSGKLTACPAWLGLSEDRKTFVFLPDRAAIVRDIFEMSSAGLGGYTIAKRLNAKKVASFGPSPDWNQATIHNLLRNRATLGEYQPKLYEKRESVGGKPRRPRDRKGTPQGKVVLGYYPPVIDEELFERAQERRRENLASGRGRRGHLVTNLFAGIPTCAYCSAPVKFHSNGSAKSLICSNVIERKGCIRTGWSYPSFERSFFDLMRRLDNDDAVVGHERKVVSELLGYVDNLSGTEIYDARLSLATTLNTAIDFIKIASSGPRPVAEEADTRIRRDHPDRMFELAIRGGSTRRWFAAGKSS